MWGVGLFLIFAAPVAWWLAVIILNDPNEADDLGHAFVDADCRTTSLMREMAADARTLAGGGRADCAGGLTNGDIARRHEGVTNP